MTPQIATMLHNDDLADVDENCEKKQQSKPEGGYYLRWSRLGKYVELNDKGGSGLIRSSIAAQDKSKDAAEAAAEASVSNQSRFFNRSPVETKCILKNVSGRAAPGEVLAVMGPSGSGKTSLLNCLSGRSSYQEGDLSINGYVVQNKNDHSGMNGGLRGSLRGSIRGSIRGSLRGSITGGNNKGGATNVNMKQLMSKMAYVKQADIFFEHLTVQDQLTYTALLRLPHAMSRASKDEEVRRILRLLRLEKVAASSIMMLSGGEKKRVNIGTELLTNPTVLLLDEPTSGLDSTSAVSLLKLLRKMAVKEGKTVITTIHQPSSQVFQGFDKLLMISEGCVVYFGSPLKSLDYLEQQKLACPTGYNAADHWMDLLVLSDDGNEEEDGDDRDDEQQQALLAIGNPNNPSKSPREQLQLAWDNDAVSMEMDAAVEGSKQNHDGTLSDDLQQQQSQEQKYNTPWWTQYGVLVHRSLKGARSSIFTLLNMIKSLAVGVVVGLVWWRMPYTEQTVSDRAAYYFFTMSFWVFDAMFTALMTFPQEKVVIMKERASKSYHLSAYFMAKMTSDAPVRLILPFLYMLTSFWMAGIDDRVWVFFASTGCTLLSVLAGESFGLFIGTWFSDLEQAIVVMTVLTLALLLLGGFFVQNLPPFVVWAKYLSPFKYAYDGSLQLVFNRNVPCDGSGGLGNLCTGNDGEAYSEDVLRFLGVSGTVGFNIGLLFVLIIVLRFLAFLGMRRQKASDRS